MLRPSRVITSVHLFVLPLNLEVCLEEKGKSGGQERREGGIWEIKLSWAAEAIRRESDTSAWIYQVQSEAVEMLAGSGT